MITISLSLDTLIVWILVGLVAGFLASHLLLGHGMGLFTDVLVGILGAIVGGFLANYFNVHVTVPGHPILTEMIVAFFGALVLVLVVRLVSVGTYRKRPLL
jgi:uncharacterized membrane protein YeaQ/YmgE (transglycosylase-associated protein family)